jgi:hypothetical protein
MAYYVVHHKVNDFGVWKKVYDEFGATRERYGVIEHYALQSTDNPNHVMVIGEGSLEAIQNFLQSEELKSGMQSAGIAGAPDIFVGEDRK